MIIGFDESSKRGPLVQNVVIEMQLEGADAGHDIDHAGQGLFLELRHQGMNANAKLDVQDDRTIFNQYVAVALLAVNRARAQSLGRRVSKDR